MSPLSLSTCWNCHRHRDGEAMLEEIARLGFAWTELGHGIRLSLVPGILRAIQSEVIQISSVHNFCPLPTGVTRPSPDLFMPTSTNPREWEQWVRHTCRTIDFAQQIGVRRVVLHGGRVDGFFFSPSRKLKVYRQKHRHRDLSKDPVYQRLVARAQAKVRHKMHPMMEQLRLGLLETAAYAQPRGVRLGLENRERFTDLPLEDDFKGLLESLGAGDTVGYWHDTGHAKLKEEQGWLQHEAHLASLSSWILGFHLHDVRESHDHLAPGLGSIDFGMIMRHARPEHTMVLELHPMLPESDVRSAKALLEEHLAVAA